MSEVILTEEEAYRGLFSAIILRAVEDWRSLCTKPTASEREFDKLRKFFRSEYCQWLCGDLCAVMILDKLEREKDKIRNNGRLQDV